MDPVAFEHHLLSPQGAGALPRNGAHGVAGGAVCGDLVRFGVAVEGERIAAAGFEASGCGATAAAASAAVALVRGRTVLDAARVGMPAIVEELGGLSPGKLHAAELVADALHRAMGTAAHEQAAVALRAERVLVAMSGGVDSAVAALLCAQGGDGAQGGEGRPVESGPVTGRPVESAPVTGRPVERGASSSADVVAVTLELWRDGANDGASSCCSADAVRSARALAHRMGLPHLTLDLRDAFRAGVVQPFLDDHAAGLTPNPCVRCNGNVRLDAMLELAGRLGAGALATGHYARLHDDGAGPLLRVAADPAKDQSYMLAGLAPASLERLRFPLGELHKPRVRELAEAAALPVARAPESQDLCFLAGTGKAAFLARHGGQRERPGDVVDRAGRVLARHRGHQGFTVGQRRGTGVGGGGAPAYVLETDARANRVVIGPREALSRDRVAVRDVTLHRDAVRVDRVKLRYRSAPLACSVREPSGAGAHARLTLDLSEPALGPAPGQAAVLMDGELVVGSATIVG